MSKTCRCKKRPLPDNWIELKEQQFRQHYPFAGDRTIKAYRRLWASQTDGVPRTPQQVEDLVMTASASLLADDIDRTILEEILQERKNEQKNEPISRH